MLDIPRKARRQAYHSLVVFSQNTLVDPRLEVEPFGVSERYDLDEVVVSGIVFRKQDQVPLMAVLIRVLVFHPAHRGVYLAADHRVYPLLLALLVKVDRAEHIAVIRDSETVKTQFFRPRDDVFYAAGPVKEAVLSMKM